MTRSMANLVVALDGSAFAEGALPVATKLAEALDAELTVARVANWDEIDAARDYLDGVAGSLPRSTTATCVEGPDPALGLLEVIEALPDPVICLATHGRAGLGSALLGNVADAVLGATTAPMVLVGPASTRPARSWPGGGEAHVIVCFDGSDHAAAVVPLAARLAEALRATLHLTMVLHREGTFLGGHDAAPALERARLLVDGLAHEGVEVELRLLDGLEPAHEVCRLAEQLPAALVVTATHGHGGVLHALMGATATRIAHHAICPVVVRRPAPAPPRP